jgi:hypothetical protein
MQSVECRVKNDFPRCRESAAINNTLKTLFSLISPSGMGGAWGNYFDDENENENDNDY